jgi:hypothetical protein
MSVGPTQRLPASIETQVEPGGARANVPVSPGPEQDSYGKAADAQNASSTASDPQDEVNVQFEPPGEIAVYRLVSSDGRLIVQVPSEQMLSIAREITQLLAREAASLKPAAIEEGK